MITNTLRGFLIDRLGELGLSQSELSRISGVSTSDLSGIMQGRIKLPGADKRRRLAKALGVSHLDLLVAAGEITQEELGTVAGVVERNSDDPRERTVEWRYPEPFHSLVSSRMR